ncbi:MAG: bifunctional metallophosphatase/5'-nucleotidase [Syntrophomonadaceae bacterium]|nr:bifunctional metallophosphatase/5'-nucleotidase [Syntrophomonadaceae bacterium]
MKKFSANFGVLIILVLIVTGTSWLQAAEQNQLVTILFTHDLHDNLLPFNLAANGQIESRGGYARLQTVINRQKALDPQLMLLDGGDYSMGTLFQTIFAQQSPGLRLLGKMGYDVTTFGNHEFDFRPQGLAGSLNAARSSQERLPQIVSANVTIPVNEEGKIVSSDLKDLKQAMDDYGVKPYTILQRKGYKIGVFGLIGYEAASNAPMAGVTFADPLEQARRITDILVQQEKVDMIVCLSHSGTVDDPDKSEDIVLARKVPQIDVIISGHTHSKLEQPIVVGDTYICSADEYGQNLGVITLHKESTGIWKKNSYRLFPIDDTIPADEAVSARIEAFKNLVQTSYLDDMGLTFDERLAYIPFSYNDISEIGTRHAEQPLGNLISDAYIYAVQQAEASSYEPVDVAVVPYGTIRSSFVQGDITVADAFNVSSLGIGKDKKSGYPLISVYLTGKELKTACEVDASITPLMEPAQLYMSGLTYTFNPHRMIFNKVTDAALLKADGTRVEIDDNELYRVVAGLYSAQMLSVVGDKSFGILSLVPKTKAGVPITDFEAQIINTADGGEIKEWAAIARYLHSFAPAASEGLPQVPVFYQQVQGRKIVDHETSLKAVLSQPNRIALVIYAVIVLLLLLFILLVRIIVKQVQKIRRPRPTEVVNLPSQE